jgi:hypothetical protein
MEEEADKARAKAVERKQKAANMVKTSQHLVQESKDAKKKFVQEEAPMENASKLSAHDHSTYRKAELEVAQTVTMLSRKPGDAKLLKKVHKLVKEAQKDRKNMDKDHVMLSSLEEKIASLQVGKSNSFSSLKDESVSLRKRAGVVEETVKALKQESRHLRTKAEADIAKAKPEMSAPDKLHQEAQALRDKYSVQLKHISALQASLADNAKLSSHTAAKKTAAPKTVKSAAASSASSAAASKAKQMSALPKLRGLATASKGAAHSKFLAGLFSAPWNKAGGRDTAAI